MCYKITQMFFSSKSTRTLHWMPLEGVGTHCDKKYIRLKAAHEAVLLETGQNALIARMGYGTKKRFAKGDVGFCYSATPGGVMFVGFGKDASNPPPDHASSTQYDFCIQVTWHEAGKFEIEAPQSSGIAPRQR